MRHVLVAIIAASVVFACAGLSFAGKLKSVTLSVTTTGTGATNDTATTTIDGYIDTIILDVATATSTGNVSVLWQPPESTISQVTLAHVADMAADTTIRYRVDGTGTDGTALTSDPPGRVAIAKNGVVTLSTTNASAEDIVFNAVIIYEAD